VRPRVKLRWPLVTIEIGRRTLGRRSECINVAPHLHCTVDNTVASI